MKYAVCILPLAHMRLLPDHREELTSQLLFGEYGTVIEERDGWILLQNNWDGYIGWCRKNQFLLLEEEPPANAPLAGDWSNTIYVNGHKMVVPFASRIPAPGDLNGHLSVSHELELITPGNETLQPEHIHRYGMLFHNTSYLWGGRSVFGIDCSAFVQTIYRVFNIPLLRDAKQQVNQGEAIGFLQEAACGDLAFFEENGEIMHVGILLNDHEILHASGNVRIDPIDPAGIVRSDTGERTHRLRIIKRMV